MEDYDFIGQKRCRPDTEDDFPVGDISKSKRARVHGVMTKLSPMKSSTSGKSKYFSGELTDGGAKVRFVGFDSKLHERMSRFHEKKEAIALSNCEVKEGKYSSGLEVVVRGSSELMASPKKFDVPAKMFDDAEDIITLDELRGIANFQRVSVRVKVIVAEEPVTVKNGLVKQEYVVADATGSCKVVTWEKDIGCMEMETCYELIGLMTRVFKGEKYLSIPKDGFEIKLIGDIGAVEDNAVELTKDKKVCNVIILGVKYLDTYSGCYGCGGKVQTRSEVLGQCTRCKAVQRLERCDQKTSARVDVASEDGMQTLSVFSPVAEEICKGAATVDALLSCDAFDAMCSETDVIVSICR